MFLPGPDTRHYSIEERYTDMDEKPIACCPLNGVEAYGFPFFIKKGSGVEPDQLLLEIHLWHMTADEREVMGELLQISKEGDLKEAGYTKDDREVYII